MIFSPNLLSNTATTNCEIFKFLSTNDQINHLLNKITKDRHLNSLKDSIRLGILFEALLHFYLSNAREKPGDTDATAIYHNVINRLQVNSSGKAKRTLGEFDFLYIDNQRNTSNHLETAVKFYLADVNCAKDLHTLSSWIGPNKNDRLDLKVDKLFDHQLRLTDIAEAKVLLKNHSFKGRVTKSLLLKGVLFVPWKLGLTNTKEYLEHLPSLVNPDNEFGYWVNISHVYELIDELYFAKILHRQQWLTFNPITESVLYKQIQNYQLDDAQELMHALLKWKQVTDSNRQLESDDFEQLNGYANLNSASAKQQFLNSLKQKLHHEQKPFQMFGIKYHAGKVIGVRYFIVSDDWSATTAPSCNQ